MNKIDAKKVFFGLVALNILLIGATLAVFATASSAAGKKSQKISQLKAEQQSNDQLIGYYKVLQNTLKSNQDLESIIQKVLPADKDQSLALADIDNLSKKDKVAIQQINFNPGTSKGAGQTLTSPSGIKGVSVISVSLNCAGVPYTNLLTFLKDIENTQRRMQINSLNISPNTTNPSLLDHVDLIVDIYLKAGA
jgi:Tfp pilus assembly protein PilO